MGIALIVTRSYDRNFHETGLDISLEEWEELVSQHDDLRLVTEALTTENPRTGELLSMGRSPGETELRVSGRGILRFKSSWEPFLFHRRGDLVMGYTESLDNPKNPVRRKVGEVARQLKAIITHDAGGDDVLDW